MKKLSVIFLVFLCFGFSSCRTAGISAKKGSDWVGVYTGTVPGADSGIKVEIKLNKDCTYKVTNQYIDKSDSVYTYTGTFSWNDNNIIRLDNKEIPPYYLVGENSLTQLNMEGVKIAGELADNYILKKESFH